MKVLILCDTFPPAFGPRMGYLCKYIKQAGWEPTVITEHIPDETFSFLKGDTNVQYVEFYKAKKRITKTLEWVKVFLSDVLFNYKNRQLYNAAIQEVKKEKYHLILCSSYRTFPLPAALKLAQKTNLPLVVDLRDIIEQYTGNEFISKPLPKLLGLENRIASVFKKQSLKKRNHVLRNAAHITTISPWHTDILKQFNPNVTLIYNGYDPDVFYPDPVRSNRFYITYTGRILSIAMRNPDLLFQAITRLSKEQIITPDSFQVRWFMDEVSHQIIQKETSRYPIAGYMSYFGYVPASKVPAILNESAILLLLTNKAGETGPKGIMTTKFFEALAVEKPILCVRGDEGCLENIIDRTQSGLSAHQADEVYLYIKENYLQWKTSGQVTTRVNHAEIEMFSRKAQAGQFIYIFEQLAELNG